MGARLLSGGLRRDAVWGLGGATVMDSLTPKFQVTGDPGLESTLLGTSPTTSLCLVGLAGGMESIVIGPICLIRCRLSKLSGFSGSCMVFLGRVSLLKILPLLLFLLYFHL